MLQLHFVMTSVIQQTIVYYYYYYYYIILYYIKIIYVMSNPQILY